MKKANVGYVIGQIAEHKKSSPRWKLDTSVFVKYITIWGISFVLFFAGTCIATLLKNNSYEHLFYETIANNSVLSLSLSLLFSSFAELLWEDSYEKRLENPKKIVTAFSFVIVILLFLINNLFDIFSVTNANSIIFDLQYEINFAVGITVLLLSVIHFLLLSFKKIH